MNDFVLKIISTIAGSLLAWSLTRSVANIKNSSIGKLKRVSSTIFIVTIVIITGLLTVLCGAAAVSNLQDGMIGVAISLGITMMILLASFMWYTRELIRIYLYYFGFLR